MNKIIKYIGALAIGSLMSMSIMAQKATQEVSLWGGGGLSTMQYKLSGAGNHKSQMGGQIGVGYTYFFTESIGLGSGLEMSFHNSKADIGSITSKYWTDDIDNNNFEYRSTTKGYKEKQNVIYLNIPIMLQYQTTGTYKFYGALGGKIGLPISEKYTISGADFHNTGYYPQAEVVNDDNPYFGFGDFLGKSTKEDLDLRMSITLSAEAGMKWTLTDDLSLYTGIYFDYGLNNINKNSVKAPLIQYNSTTPSNFYNNSILHSYQDGDAIKRIVNKVNLMAVGIKVKVAFEL